MTNRTDQHRGRSSELETVQEIWSRRKWVALVVFATLNGFLMVAWTLGLWVAV